MRIRLNVTIGDLGYRFRVSESRASTFCFMWVNLIFYNLPASNITGLGPEMPKRKYRGPCQRRQTEGESKENIFHSLWRGHHKRHVNWGQNGFLFPLQSDLYVCDYLMKMNNENTDSSSPNPNE
jgi:hypothetical protein